ncbi:THO complex subunit 4D isoform X2 [Ziziphus jujuba]|uniref:THO complex subunit 4D isoform X2 n=1 Tax=Ziziphus jujuba TaxID=326968 RepID=A0ABM3IF40_ZIZJJ|nr:THO complex subunit 4D isoform X2 [Ziziphus jujuba]
MTTPLDMSLDDMIKSSRGNRERVRDRGRARRGRGSRGSFGGGRMTGPIRRGPLTLNAQPSPYMIAKSSRRVKSFPWRHDLFEDSLRAAGITQVEIGTKLYVSNLDNGVTNEDIRELFAEIGDLRRYAVHYDKNGRPSGSAEVVYTRRSDAFAALKRYNNVLLDGKPMKIEIVGANPGMPISARVNVTGVNGGRRRRTVVMTPGPGRAGGTGGASGSALVNRGSGSRRGGLGNARGRGRGGGGRGGGGRGGGGRGKKKPVEKSAVELDKELDSYHADAMNT